VTERQNADDVALREAIIWDAIIDSNGTNDAVRAVVRYLAEAGFTIVRTELSDGLDGAGKLGAMSIPEPVYKAFLTCPVEGCPWQRKVDFPDEDAAHHGEYFEHYQAEHNDGEAHA
jgi:hypothetical protein